MGTMRITKDDEDNWAGFHSKQQSKGEMVQVTLLKKSDR